MGQEQQAEERLDARPAGVVDLAVQDLLAARLVVVAQGAVDVLDDVVDVLRVGGAGDVLGGRFVVHTEVVGRPVVQFLRAPVEPARRVAGVVLAGFLPPVVALGLAQVPDQFVQGLWHSPGALALEPAVHLLFQCRERVRAGWLDLAHRLLPGLGLGGLLVVFQHRIPLHPQQDARVEQRPPRAPQVRLVESVQELVGHRHDVDVPGVDLAVLCELDQHLDGLDFLVCHAGHPQRRSSGADRPVTASRPDRQATARRPGRQHRE